MQEQHERQERHEQPQGANYSLRELNKRMNQIQNQVNHYMNALNDQLQELKRSAESKGEKINNFKLELDGFKQHVNRMEESLLQELRLSQGVMKAMLEHDMSIEKAKLDFEQKLQQKENDLKQRQAEFELSAKQSREEMKRSMYIKIGGVMAPVLIAATTLIVKWIESL